MSTKPNVTAPQALKRLIEGNKRFISGQSIHPNQDETRRQEVVDGQLPFAVVISCSDSRVPPEIVFDQGIGDIFVIRTAGNVIDDVALGSIEYGVEHLGAPLVVVMGHEKCGAVTAAVHGREAAGHIGVILEKIAPAIDKAMEIEGDIIANAIDCNIENIVNQLRTSEPVMAQLLKSGKVKIGGARYDLSTGKVIFIDK